MSKGILYVPVFWFFSKGKTTLLKHIANRALSIPPNIDVLLCEQGKWALKEPLCLCSHTDSDERVCFLEVVADDTPAVQAVLKADTRRLRLLETEKRLQARLDRGEDSVSEELEKVCFCLPGLFPGNHIIFIAVSEINKSIYVFINLKWESPIRIFIYILYFYR